MLGLEGAGLILAERALVIYFALFNDRITTERRFLHLAKAGGSITCFWHLVFWCGVGKAIEVIQAPALTVRLVRAKLTAIGIVELAQWKAKS